MDDKAAQKALRKILYAVAVLFFTVILTFVASVIWANRSAHHAESEAKRALRESEQAWCEILTSISIGQRANPPTTPAGREFATRIQNLIKKFECEEGEK